jgi:hypothetical protein
LLFLGEHSIRKKNKLTKKDQKHQGIAEAPNSLSAEIRFGAPSGPRQQRDEKYDGHQPLEYPGLEAVAQHLATPKSLRELKSDSNLAKHFHVTRMTVLRAKKDIDVIKRAHWLSMHNKIMGELVARREYSSITEKAVALAKEGNIAAMKLAIELAFPEDKQAKKSSISSSSLEEVLERAEIEYEKHAATMTSTWLTERAKRLASGKPPVAATPYVEPPKLNAEPAAESAPVNSCDSCGNTRCLHGRCPLCDVCEMCEKP